MKNNVTARFLVLHLGSIVIITSIFFIADAQSNAIESKEYFSIVVIPDTQYYSANHSWIFENQTKWIIENIESMNIVFVTHLGDLVDHPLRLEEWDNANKSMSKLDDNVPFGVLPGNHDGVENINDLANYNTYFGFDRFSNESWYGGAYQNINSNNYQFFSGEEDDFLIFHIQYNPSDDVLSWASEVIDKYPRRRVIVSTHDFVHGYNYYSNSRSKIGDFMWDKLVKPHADQIFLVLSGHYENEDRITSLEDGYFVHQLLSDYQSRPEGGNGWLRIIKFSTIDDEISIKTYSPYLNQYETDSNSQFILDEKITESKFMLLSILPVIIPLVVILIVGYFFLRIIRKIKKASV